MGMRFMRALNGASILCVLSLTLLAGLPMKAVHATHADTTNGEIEDRPSPTFRRICLAGTIAGDGIFTGVYTDTAQKGAYGFRVAADVDEWHQGSDPHVRDDTRVSPRFLRELRVSAAGSRPSRTSTAGC